MQPNTIRSFSVVKYENTLEHYDRQMLDYMQIKLLLLITWLLELNWAIEVPFFASESSGKLFNVETNFCEVLGQPNTVLRAKFRRK